MKFLGSLPYPALIIAAIFLGLAPLTPAPHVYEKVEMLLSGQLSRPLDLFDLTFHLSPSILLLLKWLGQRKN